MIQLYDQMNQHQHAIDLLTPIFNIVKCLKIIERTHMLFCCWLDKDIVSAHYINSRVLHAH